MRARQAGGEEDRRGCPSETGEEFPEGFRVHPVHVDLVPDLEVHQAPAGLMLLVLVSLAIGVAIPAMVFLLGWG